VGGVLAGPRLDEVPDNCFRLPSRINSTWGGGLVDMVRSTHCFRVIEQANLIDNARVMGEHLLEGLRELAAEEPRITAPRGRGLIAAFDLPGKEERDSFYEGLFEIGLLVLRCGERSIRFRPALDITEGAVREALSLIREQCGRMRRGVSRGSNRSLRPLAAAGSKARK
jgi:L-lysine 6-transaminase